MRDRQPHRKADHAGRPVLRRTGWAATAFEQTKLGFAPTEANFAHWIHPAETEATVVIRLW
jgi:hypothetical protein